MCAAGMLSMDSPETKRRMMEEALLHREVQNETAPPVWMDADASARTRIGGARVDYTPEDFRGDL